MGLQCDKEDVAYKYKYSFVEQVDLFPAKKSYAVGDTIWLQYTNPNSTLYDRLSNQKVEADTVSLDFGVAFNVRYGVQFLPADGLCDYITPNGVNFGRLSGPGNGTGLIYSFGCNSTNRHNFTIGIVPKQIGIYSLELTDNGYVTGCSNRISGFPFSSIGYRFTAVDGNKDIYLAIPPNSRGESNKGYTERRIDNKEVFIVQVK
jgi:hypothetical protein